MSRTERLMAVIRQRIQARALGPGEKLPSIRRLAREHQLSPSTVVEAYDRLSAEGLVKARAGSGFYVAGIPVPVPAEVPRALDRAVDPYWVARQALDSGPALRRPGCGWLPPDWMPEAALRRAIRALARSSDAVLAEYGAARGAPALRALLMRQFAAEGEDIRPDQVLLTASGTQALDLVCRLLVGPGDTVLVDDPCYFNFLGVLRAQRARVIGVPYTTSGPDIAQFRAAVATYRPRLYLTNSAIHNPTGAALAPHVAHNLLVAAAEHDVTIVEDAIFADLEPEPSVRLAALGGPSRVIRIGSFSKTLSASIRCGYIVARPDWIEGLADLQVATNFGGPSPMAAELVLRTLSDGSYGKHLSALRGRLARRRREMAVVLEGMGVKPWVLPRGGFQLWCRLPEGRDSAALAKAALREGVVFAPGNAFSVSQSAGDMMRFNVTQMDGEVVRVLGNLLR